jgi:hypothetical protein
LILSHSIDFVAMDTMLVMIVKNTCSSISVIAPLRVKSSSESITHSCYYLCRSP